MPPVTPAEPTRPRIALTAGEPAGIGPELIARLAGEDLGVDLVLLLGVRGPHLVDDPRASLLRGVGDKTVLVECGGQAHELSGAGREGGLRAHVGRQRVEQLEQL